MTRGKHDPDWDADQHETQTAVEKPPVAEGSVRVKCIVDTMPFTDQGPLARDEEADVPAAIAELMIKRKQVEKV
jgi:hypothetical protein